MNWYKLSSRVLRYPPDLVAICKEVVQQVPEVTDKLEKGDTKYIGRKEITSPYNKDKITVDFQITSNPKLPFTASIDPHPNGVNWFFVTVNGSKYSNLKNMVYVLVHELLHAIDPKQIGYTGEDNSEELARQGKSDQIYQMEEEQDAYSGEIAVEVNEKVREALEDTGKKRTENLIYIKRDLEYSLESLKNPGYSLELPPADETMRHTSGPMTSWKKVPEIWNKFLSRMYHVFSEALAKVKPEIPEGATAPNRTEDEWRERRKKWKTEGYKNTWKDNWKNQGQQGYVTNTGTGNAGYYGDYSGNYSGYGEGGSGWLGEDGPYPIAGEQQSLFQNQQRDNLRNNTITIKELADELDEDPLVVLATMREKYGNDVAAHMFTPIPESLAEIVRGWFFDTGNPRATQQVYPGYAGGPLEEPDDEEDYKMEQAPSQNDPDYDEKFAKWYQNHITKVHAQREKIKRRRIAREQEKAKQEEYERKLEQQGTPIDRGVKPRGRDPGPGWEYDTVNHLWRKVKEKAEEQPKKPILPPVAPLDAQPIDTHFPEAIDPVFEDKGEENSHEFSPEEIDAYIAREKAKAQRVNHKKGRGRKSYFN